MALEKLVSVCINAYNSADVIGKTIESVLNQTYKNLQIVIVDDCSTDNTAEIVKSYDDDRIELYTLPKNFNISNANNECLHRARGEYIAHIDSDDIWVEDKIEKQIKFLEENPYYGACFTHATLMDKTGRSFASGELPEAFLTLFNRENMTQAGFVRRFYDSSNFLCHSSVVMRKSVYEKLGDHDLTLNKLHDYDYWIRMNFICPLYIYPEKLVFYRIWHANNSTLANKDILGHNEEYVRIAYKLVNDCPREMFLEAFSDKLQLKEYTDEELELEKAFVLGGALHMYPDNKVLEMKKLDELFKDKKYAELAEEKFGFTIRDLYNLHKNEVYFDKREADRIKESLNSFKELYESEKESARLEREKNAELSRLNAEAEQRIQELNAQYAELSGQYSLVVNSRSYRLFAPLRKIKKLFTILRSTRKKYTRDGIKVTSRFMLYGFYGHNVGDDAFFDMLFKRYPDTMFYVLLERMAFDACSDKGYPDTTFYDLLKSRNTELFSRYPNVRFYDATRPDIIKINAFGKKFNQSNLFEKLLLKICDGVVHIGGSIYQQIGNWQLDFDIRKERKLSGKKFFAVSNNFGPYTDNSYRDMWAGEFKEWTDICFRDRYSCKLFSDIPAVRYAPDLLFSFPVAKKESEKKVSVSVIDTLAPFRSMEKSTAEAYENKIVELIKRFSSDGYAVSLLSFCAFEGDNAAADRILAALPEEISSNVKNVVYSNALSEIINEIETSEYIVATRFHAMILGYIAGKRVLPICYSEKMSNVISDLSLSESIITLDKLSSLTADELIPLANTVPEEKINELSHLATGQFAGFDKFVSRHHGEIAE